MDDNRDAWHSQDNFWELLEPFLFDQQRVSLAVEQVDQVIELLQLQTGARILDLPCGIGRHSFELAARGYDVTGVDGTARYVERARLVAANRGLSVQFELGDMREYKAMAHYDAVLNLFGSFGYFDDPADDLRVVRHMYDALRPGGQFLIETAGKEIIARDFQARDWAEAGDTLVLMDRSVGGHWERIDSRYIVIREGQRFEHQVSIRSYAAAELAALLGTGGFGDVRVYGSLGGRPYDQDAERLVVIGRK